MQKFINMTIKPVLIIGGLATAAAGLDAFFPRFAVENIQKMTLAQFCSMGGWYLAYGMRRRQARKCRKTPLPGHNSISWKLFSVLIFALGPLAPPRIQQSESYGD